MRPLALHPAVLLLALLGAPGAATAECTSEPEGGWPIRTGSFTDPAAPPAPTTDADGRTVVAFASYNVEYGEQRTDELIADLRRLEAQQPLDLILLQEVNGAPDGSTSAAERIARALGLHWAWAPAHRRAGRDHGTAVLSRWPLSGARSIPLPDSPWVTCRRRAPIAVDADLAGRRIRLYSVHLATVFPDTLWTEPSRAAQLEPVLADADLLPPGVPVLVAGDVNTVNPFGARALEAALARHGFTPAHVGAATGPHLGLALDRAWARGFGRLLAAGADPRATGSDHLPIWGLLRLDPPP